MASSAINLSGQRTDDKNGVELEVGMATSDESLSVEIGIGDTRRADRLHVVDLLCSVGKRCSGEVVDISETGVCVKYNGAKRYEIGDELGMALRRHDVLLLVRATVVWLREPNFNEHVAGFQFSQLQASDGETIRELLSRSNEKVDVAKSA